MSEVTVIDGENKILGRLASEVARRVKDGEEVHIVNSEKAVVSGDKKEVLADYKQKFDRGRRDRGPYFQKRPDKILKRTVKNMLPDGPDGRELRSNYRTYLQVPDRFDEVQDVDVKEGDDLRNRNYVTLTEISEHIGSDFRGEQN
ncbi:MAG: large subunit ribosomal protein L13 [Candidatus Nanohaloarchaea archaeon]|jgi:large subunit ribosomal protein L13